MAAWRRMWGRSWRWWPKRYLLRSNAEWTARQAACKVLDEIIEDLREGDVRAIGGATQRNFDGPIQSIIPWASNLYTETLIREVRAEFGDAFWGFWMLGGMSGGGMGFIFDPKRKPEAQNRLGPLMNEVSTRLAGGVAFAMKPVVYDFSINERGTFAELKTGSDAILPDGYYNIVLPALLRKDQRLLSACERGDLERFSALSDDVPGARDREPSKRAPKSTTTRSPRSMGRAEGGGGGGPVWPGGHDGLEGRRRCPQPAHLRVQGQGELGLRRPAVQQAVGILQGLVGNVGGRAMRASSPVSLTWRRPSTTSRRWPPARSPRPSPRPVRAGGPN